MATFWLSYLLSPESLIHRAIIKGSTSDEDTMNRRKYEILHNIEYTIRFAHNQDDNVITYM